MAGSSTSIGIIVEAQDRATAQLKKVEQQLESLGKGMNDTSKKSGGLGSSFKNLAIAGTVMAGAWQAFDFLKSSVLEFHEAESAMSRLAYITNNATGATKEMVQELFNQAQALEKIGVIDATTIMNGQAKLATFDLQTSAIKNLTPALLNLVVGEYGLNASSEAVTNTANGLGKALQGNVELFTKQGFIVSESQREMLKYGDESERVTTINEILGSTYDDLNEKMAQTSEGHLINMQNRFKSVKEEIGKGVTPTISLLINELFGMTKAVGNGADGFAQFGEIVYRTTNFILGIGKSIKTGLLTVVGSLDVGITSLFNKDKANEKAKAWGETMLESAESTMSSFKEFATASKFKMPDFNFFGNKPAGTNLGGALGVDKKAVSEVTDKLADLSKAYKSFAVDADDALFDIAQSHKDKMASIKKEMQGVRNEMSALQAEYEKGKKSDIQNVASQIVSEEQKIADIQKEMQGDVSQARFDELSAELLKRKTALEENSLFMSSIEGALTEARRVANLTDLQKAIEDYNTRRTIAEEEFNIKMSNLQSELSALKQKRKEENQLYEEKRDFIQKTELELSEQYQKFMSDNLAITKDGILKEIEYYKMLADAIRASRSGNSAELSRISNKVTKVNDAIISPKGDVITTHPDDYLIATKNPRSLTGGGGVVVNINGGMYLDQNSARKIGDEIIRALDMQFKY